MNTYDATIKVVSLLKGQGNSLLGMMEKFNGIGGLCILKNNLEFIGKVKVYTFKCLYRQTLVGGSVPLYQKLKVVFKNYVGVGITAMKKREK